MRDTTPPFALGNVTTGVASTSIAIGSFLLTLGNSLTHGVPTDIAGWITLVTNIVLTALMGLSRA